MNSERWRQVDKIFSDVWEQKPEDRSPFLDRACADDASLREEVESLLRAHTEAGSFLNAPAAQGQGDSRGSTSLAGKVFGRYELGTLLGSGGMGDVYSARDSDLKRHVAVKVLPQTFSRDTERVSRFRREAEVLASLNHPNIAAIYDLETLGDSKCLVLEFVDGETLAERVKRGPIAIDETLQFARQIAEALEAAHEKGIVHRDLKPANIKMTPTGTIKVLDFGLAKVRERQASTDAGALNSTATMATTPGMIMGTAAYMAPEQARGKEVDKRADIWAFGCLFYEMLTGRSLFGRETPTDTLAAILERDPDWSALPAGLPETVPSLLSRCLDKNLRSRLHDVADARIEIENAINGVVFAAAKPGIADRRKAPAAVPWSIAGPASLIGLAAIVVLMWRVFTTPEAPLAPLPSRLVITSMGEAVVRPGNLHSLAITPDGRNVIYIGANTLFVRQLDQLEPRAIVNGSAPLNSVFTNNQWLGYVEGKSLKKVALSGGRAMTILGPRFASLGATWETDDAIISADDDTQNGLQRVSTDGSGKVTVLTHPDKDRGERDHAWPEMLPGGRGVLFTITAVTGGENASQVAVLDLATNKIKPLVGGSRAQYVASGHLIYGARGALQAIGFDPVTLTVFGAPTIVQPLRPTIRTIGTSRESAGDFSVAENGTLLYLEGPAVSSADLTLGAQYTLVWVDRNGMETPLGFPAAAYLHPSLSPDRTHISVNIGGSKVWAGEVSGRTLKPVVSNGGQAIWLNSTQLAFHNPRENGKTLFMIAADGSGSAQALSIGPPSGITPDGKKLLVYTGGRDIVTVSLDGTARIETLLKTESSERNGVVSQDGHWLAYESDSSGAGPFDIYVAPFPDATSRKWKVSKAGGTRPLWSPVGLELFYVAPDGALMSVRFDPQSGPLGDPTVVVKAGPYMTRGGGGAVPQRTYDVSSDGQRFLMVKGDLPAPSQIVLVQHWLMEELKRLLPAKR